MCSFFGLEMENYHDGDLTDIFRVSAGALGQSSDVSNWEFPSDLINNISPTVMEDVKDSYFGDPFCNMRDPLLHELNMACSPYFSSPNSMLSTTTTSVVDDASSTFLGSNTNNILGHKVFEEDIHKSPYNMFSRIQISPNNPTKLPLSPSCDSPVIAAASSPRGFQPSAIISGDMISVNNSKSCLIENAGPVQISSPRNLGIKRRKNQAKKVVCIPAPATANSRPSGEVVPSDLWAWRKYGQKPIKGSPHPRGYYRCSSSKGCSARKQVERSRTDPNMLVITYTSEHNHPWPTQRNALAGSTRSQPQKNNNAASKSSSAGQPQKSTANTKEEQKESSNDTTSPTIVGASSTASAPIKEEVDDVEKHIAEMEDTDQFGEELPHGYRPAIPESNSHSEDLFADLGEIEADPLDLLFSQGFAGDEQRESKAGMDPFSIFDWSSDNNNNNNTTSFGEAKRGL